MMFRTVAAMVLNMLVTIAVACMAIAGYQYNVEGYGLHPLFAALICWVLSLGSTVFCLMVAQSPVRRFKS